jgi:ABC-type uncharacterized transport system ATPase subunit
VPQIASKYEVEKGKINIETENEITSLPNKNIKVESFKGKKKFSKGNVFVRPEITEPLPIIYEEENSVVSEEEKDL